VSTTGPVYAALIGVAVLVLLLNRATSRIVGQVVTLVHELGHAAVGLLVGGRVQRISISLDASGETLTLLGGRAPKARLTAFTLAGYPAPCLVGLLAAFAVSTEDHRLFLLLSAVLVAAALALWVRNVWGVVVFAGTAVGLWLVAAEAGDAVTRTAAIALAWLFSIGGLRSAWHLTTGARTSGKVLDDAERVAQLTRVLPRPVVTTGFIAVAIACLLGVGALLLGSV
jgi:hypothetical protein